MMTIFIIHAFGLHALLLDDGWATDVSNVKASFIEELAMDMVCPSDVPLPTSYGQGVVSVVSSLVVSHVS
jgi:hypothetical protein